MLKSISGRAFARSSTGGFSLLEAIIVVAITLVLVALTGKGMLSALNNYNISSAARNIASDAQLARSKATANQKRYRLSITTSPARYLIQWCNTLSGNNCTTWVGDTQSGSNPLPGGVSFTVPSGVSVTPMDATTPAQATDITFNSRGLLIDNSTGSGIPFRCYYLAGNQTAAYAVCATLTGRAMVFKLNPAGTVWTQQ